MKRILSACMAILLLSALHAQLKTSPVCPSFTVDILGGKVNGLKPSSTTGEIKKLFPCFSSSEEEQSSSKCGGSIFYNDKDIYFYTGRDYIEIKEKFKGKLSLPLMGASRSSLFKWLGHPKIKDISWDAFQTEYGTLVLYYNKTNKVSKIQFSTRNSEAMTLCE